MANYRNFGGVYGRPTFYTPWAQHLYQALEGLSVAYARRLHSLRRDGGAQRVILLELSPGRILGQVADRWGAAQQVRITARVVPDEAWQRVADALAQEPGQLTSLLSRLPGLVGERVFIEAGGWLFPGDPSDLEVSCTCAHRWEPLCIHAAAVLMALCSRVEAQPTLLLTLRGWPAARLAAEVQRRWADLTDEAARQAADVEQAGLPARVGPAAFFGAGHPLPDHEPAIAAPQGDAALLKRMGRPPFAQGAEDVEVALAPLYAYVTRRAVQAWERTAIARSRRRRTRDRQGG